MIDITVGAKINRPVEDVFTYVADMTNDPAWHTDALEVRKTTEPPLGRGTTYHLQMKPSMGVSEGTAEVVEFEPNRKEVFRGDFGPMKPTVTHQFDFSDGVTTFTRRIQIEVHGPMWLMQPLIGTMVKRRNAGFLVNLKRVLEQQ